jgi:hypothetical protein
MGETPNRRAASTAAREFLQAKVDRIGDLAEAARAIDAAVEARAAADQHIANCQQAYGHTRRAAVRAGWTDNELEQLGWPPEHGPQPQRRRRPARSGRPTQPAAAAVPEVSLADAGAADTAASAHPVERDSGSGSGDPSTALPGGPDPR